MATPQGPSTDSPFTPGQHIAGINVGGWFDAGDFDLRTQTHSRVITDLVLARENFGLDWDDTTVDESARYVQIRKPDSMPTRSSRSFTACCICLRNIKHLATPFPD